MLTLKKIAITGGLSSGKSTVCRLLEELGAFVISADKIVHQLLSLNTFIKEQITQLLGSDVISDNQLNRQKIADKVFSNYEKLTALEQILHPAVMDEIEKTYLQVDKQKKYPLFVAEIPLLYESESEKFYDAVVAVVSNRDLCRERFVSNGKHKQEDFEKRMERQLDPQHKAAKADFIIENNGKLDELKEKVLSLYSTLTTT